MWTNNKTENWLQSLPNEEYEAVLNDARHNYPAHLQKLKEKQKLQGKAIYRMVVHQILIEDVKIMLYTKYESSGPCSFRQDV